MVPGKLGEPPKILGLKVFSSRDKVFSFRDFCQIIFSHFDHFYFCQPFRFSTGDYQQLHATKLLVIQFLKLLIDPRSCFYGTKFNGIPTLIFKPTICEAAWHILENNSFLPEKDTTTERRPLHQMRTVAIEKALQLSFWTNTRSITHLFALEHAFVDRTSLTTIVAIRPRSISQSIILWFG